MSHAGKYYPIEQRARIWCSHFTWPYWDAKAYRFQWSGLTGLLGFPPTGYVNASLIFPWAGTHMEYRGTVAWSGPETVEIGFFNDLQSNCIDIQGSAMLWVNDVQQFTPYSYAFPQGAGAQQVEIPYANQVPVMGASLTMEVGGFLDGFPVPWPS